MNIARKGTCMKTLVLALALGAFAQGALAAEPNCRAIESTGARLSCYDAAFPPKPKEPAAVDNRTPRAEYKDPLLAEEARIAAKLKNICRGC
ncbi:type VI secretion protein [Bradyrhizobium septentrionale]|nr:type VI secretion protein [Bradyrhizobium septentrionale]UGY18807.1 type VI secretion protein [Bradyrhizobium septentrionale]UGY27538.1 type VI secretion protein [Bradyrhizobium septentrionale]